MGRVIIDGHPLVVEDTSGSKVSVQIAVNRWHRFKRNKDEDDTALEIRMQSKVDQLHQVCCPAAAAFATCTYTTEVCAHGMLSGVRARGTHTPACVCVVYVH